MTQTHLFATLAQRCEAWADAHDGGTFAALCDAMGVGREDGPTTTDVDIAARGALRWRGGYQVGRESVEVV